MDVKLIIDENGLILDKSNAPVHANELFLSLSKGNKITNLSGVPQKINFSKRPANLFFKFNVHLTTKFEILFREQPFERGALKTATHYGYFFYEGRLYFVQSDHQSDLQKIETECTLVDALKLVRKLVSQARLIGEPSDIISDLEQAIGFKTPLNTLFEKELYPYQQEGLDWLAFCTRNGLGTILADDMGLGKTAQIIAVMCDLLERLPEAKILIVVPNPLIENWRRELLFFAPKLRPYIHYGPNRRGLSEELAGQTIIISPYTTVSSDISIFEELPFNLALFDEASMLKNPLSSRTLAAKRIEATVKIAMTGTPVENSLVDAWSISDLVFPGYLDDIKSFTKQFVSK